MDIPVYKRIYDPISSIEDFLDFYYSSRMKYLANDLLKKGLSPSQILEAVSRAMKIGSSAGMELRAHFMPLFTEVDKEIIRDCKLSNLGYGLVLHNADPDVGAVGKWQIKVLENYLD